MTEKERYLAFAQAVQDYSTVDAATKRTVEAAVKLAPRSEPVLITGETGTGKELIARILHGTRSGEFSTVNTTAVTDTLFESELFGHLKGSFTGAFRDKTGLVEHAANGTLFLDEIGDMPYDLQAKVLRFIQFGTYRRVGDNEERTANCRVIAATCAPLQDLIASGRFRKDLYYRLSTFNPYDAVHYVGENLDKSIEDSDYDTFLDYASNATLEGNYRELEQAILRYDVLKELPAQLRR
jgi:transcriptional regulator with PAS, ATPase and Fis domain